MARHPNPIASRLHLNSGLVRRGLRPDCVGTLTLLLLASLPLPAQTNPSWNWVKELAGTNQEVFSGIGTDAVGNVYVVGSTRSGAYPVRQAIQDHNAFPGKFDIFISKLDPDGNFMYSTYFGGNADDQPTAMAVDASGSVYITGTTFSTDFPSSKDAWKSSPPAPIRGNYQGSTFVMRLNPDGALIYATYFTSTASLPNALAVDTAGSVYISGAANFPNDLPVTPGAYQPVCHCGIQPIGFISPSAALKPLLSIPYTDSFLARFDPTGSKLVFATYLGAANQVIGPKSGRSLAVAPDGSAYLLAAQGVFRLNAAGSALLGSFVTPLSPMVLALSPDNSVYAAGIVYATTSFPATPGSFGEHPTRIAALSSQGGGSFTGIVRLDSDLTKVTAGTYFGSPYGTGQIGITTDAAGNLYVGGNTAPRGLPTITPLAQGFGSPTTGYAAKISGDLTSLLFSGYFGDNENFSIGGVAIGRGGALVLGGATIVPGANPGPPGSVWVNSVSVSRPLDIRVDSVVNAASLQAEPLSGGETVVVRGAGFTPSSRVLIGDTELSTLAGDAAAITVKVPGGLSGSYTSVQVRSDSAGSNSVLVPVASTSPGLYSQDGTGYGQGYILNQDGTLNSPTHPADYGERITIFATGVGPLTFDNGYAVTATPVIAQIGGFYCPGVAAVNGPVAGLPGDVYQLTVYVPTHAQIVAVNPDLATFKLPAQSSMVLRIGPGSSQNWLSISIKP
ncbi:MAG: hypothetical protein JWN34_1105 [Bryobacterales bacterium]|nr:hypothetical protein [Bryobacterales bacterium]